MNLTLKALLGLVAALVMGSMVSGTAFAGNGKHYNRDRGHQGYQYQAGSKHDGGRHYGRKRFGGHNYSYKRRYSYKRHFGQRRHFGYFYFYGRPRHYGLNRFYSPYYVPPYWRGYAQPRGQYVPPQVTYVQPQVDYQRQPAPTPAPLPSGCRMTREYQTRVVVGGEYVDAYGDTCLQADGSWKRGPAKIVPD